MNTARLKLLTWTVAGALGIALVAYVALFYRQRDALMAPVSSEHMRKILSEVPEPPARIENMVDRETFELALRKLDWTGKPPPVVVVDEAPPVPVFTGPEPIDKFVRLNGIKIDAEEPQNGEVIFKYKADARVTTVQSSDGTVRKQVGQRLDQDLSYIRIESITETGVEFAFDDAARPHEFLNANDFDLAGGYVVIGDDVVQIKIERDAIPQASNKSGPQPQTVMIRPNGYRLGYEDMEFIDKNYPTIIAEEITYGRHRDPQTGKFDGIEIKSVKSDSTAAKHGVQSGDVIKSINGHPVSSTSEAIQFIKTHKNDFDLWEVEISNRGQTRVQTYYPSQKQ